MAVIQYASAIFAAMAAILWFISALVKIPQDFPIYVEPSTPMREGYVGGTEDIGYGFSKELNELGQALRRQSSWSAAAAASAGMSAILQAVAIAYH